jgi:hypothetical protein
MKHYVLGSEAPGIVLRYGHGDLGLVLWFDRILIQAGKVTEFQKSIASSTATAASNDDRSLTAGAGDPFELNLELNIGGRITIVLQ